MLNFSMGRPLLAEFSLCVNALREYYRRSFRTPSSEATQHRIPRAPSASCTASAAPNRNFRRPASYTESNATNRSRESLDRASRPALFIAQHQFIGSSQV
jgi:hypothetical protein